MKYAIVNTEKVEATKGIVATCPICDSELIAKCGNKKVKHWAHKGVRNCDPWWENETEWHRNWKNNFSKEWQEVVHADEATGEKHIADVKTSFGLVLEFQHSFINPEEQLKRENFYKRMVWIIDGTRLKRDFSRLLRTIERNNFRPTKKQGYYLIDFIDECFPANWTNCSVPVIFDFIRTEGNAERNKWEIPLYYLLPKSDYIERVVAIIDRRSLIADIINGNFLREKQDPQRTQIINQTNSLITTPPRQSNYVLHRGKFVRRSRF